MIIKTTKSDFSDKLEHFRAERISLLGESHPIPLQDGPKIMLHMVPNNGLGNAIVDLAAQNLEINGPNPIGRSGSKRFNFDGFLAVAGPKNVPEAYLQVFHDGVIETVNGSFFYQQDDAVFIPINEWEDELIQRIAEYLNLQQRLSAVLPVFIMLSVLGVKGFRFMTQDYLQRWIGNEIDRNNLLIQPVRIASFDCEIHKELLPVFNRLWNAAGYSRSLNYDENGNRKRRR